MIASASHRFRHHAACGRAELPCVAAGSFWYGYFMTGVPAAMS